jgi:Protein of unknown function (DUF3618)
MRRGRHGSAAEIEDEIRRTRGELALTLDALAYRLAPRQLVGRGIEMITQSIDGNGGLRAEIGEAVRANRLPLAVIGAGVAWLLARNLTTAGSGNAESDVPRPERGGEAWVHQAAGAARGAIRSVRDTGGAVLERAGQYVEYAAQPGDQVRHAGGSLRAAFERYPLLIGLVGLASGAALAALLPATRRERDWVGETREELWKKAEEVGREAIDGVRNLAEHKARAAKG